MKWTLAPPVPLHGPGQFRVVIGSEIILCEAGSSKTVKILERKAEESVEAAHLNGASVYIVPTAEGLKLASASVVEVITSTKKWIKPVGAQSVTVYVIGGGGGGGSGGHNANKSVTGGGGGGGGGAVNVFTYEASVLSAEVECTIGKGGEGGAAIIEEKKVGKVGKAGGVSHFGELLYAAGGEPGAAGTEAGGEAAGGAGGQGLYSGTLGGAGKEVGVETGGPGAGRGGASGGGGGSGCSATEGKPGAQGGYSFIGSEKRAAGGKVESTPGKEGAEGAEGINEGVAGHGGGGGAGSFSNSTSGSGGKGGKYGGGGGGGGGNTVNAATSSGAGGSGGEGAIIIITEF